MVGLLSVKCFWHRALTCPDGDVHGHGVGYDDVSRITTMAMVECFGVCCCLQRLRLHHPRGRKTEAVMSVKKFLIKTLDRFLNRSSVFLAIIEWRVSVFVPESENSPTADGFFAGTSKRAIETVGSHRGNCHGYHAFVN